MAAAEKAAAEAEAEAAAEGDAPEELDEFGRDANLMRRQEAAQRGAARRQRSDAELSAVERRQGSSSRFALATSH